MSKRPGKAPTIIETMPPNKGSSETTYIVKRGTGPFATPVGYVRKVRNTRTETHPWKVWHIGWDENIVKESFRNYYDDSRYAKDGAFPGGKKAAFEYAAQGKGFGTFDQQSSGRVPRRNPKARKRARKNPPLYGERTRQVGVKHMIGLRVYEIRYQHAADGKDYKHPFETGVIMWGMPDGSVKIESATGERVWENRDV